MERCTQCGDQFLYCDCPEPLDERKRVPFIRLHWQCCERCGEPWPEMFNVPDKVWRFYILALGQGDKMLCVNCFRLISEWIDGGDYHRNHGGPVMLSEIKPDAPLGSTGRERWEQMHLRSSLED
jgi:hypothetical protein